MHEHRVQIYYEDTDHSGVVYHANYLKYFERAREHEERCRAMGIADFKMVYTASDLAPGNNIIFAATGVTDGTLMRGVRFFGDGTRTSSLIMQSKPHQIRFIDSIHVADTKGVKIQF